MMNGELRGEGGGSPAERVVTGQSGYREIRGDLFHSEGEVMGRRSV